MKKENKNEIISEELEEVIEKNTEIEETEKKPNKVLNIIKWIFIIITSPIWFPWKVLFVRKESKKFKNISTPRKVFRILRSPITKPIKLMIFLMIIGIELVVVYKVRYSPITYTFTRTSVHNYYLNSGSSKTKLMGIQSVNAAEVSDFHDELQEAFDYIDKWDLDSKNKMYVVLDADITKIAFKYMDKASIAHILNRFNSDEAFREDIKYVAKNVNKTISRAVKEFPESVPYAEDFNIILVPVTNAISAGVDYRAILDILGATAKNIMTDSNYEIDTEYEVSEEELEMIDASMDMIIKFSKGATIKEAYDFINENYSSSTETTTSYEIIAK